MSSLAGRRENEISLMYFKLLLYSQRDNRLLHVYCDVHTM